METEGLRRNIRDVATIAMDASIAARSAEPPVKESGCKRFNARGRMSGGLYQR
jgi:hypothetical protein